MILPPEYFTRPATELAKDLIGKLISINRGGEIFRYRITETECYFGEDDTACHASRGRTPRTETLYHRGGICYVYLCYGIHRLLNFVTGGEGHPEAVLIRGVEGARGPGRASKLLGITLADNAKPLGESFGIWVEDDGREAPPITATTRVGIDYAAERDRLRPWRYIAE